jgi:hypothetical protein
MIECKSLTLRWLQLSVPFCYPAHVTSAAIPRAVGRFCRYSRRGVATAEDITYDVCVCVCVCVRICKFHRCGAVSNNQ